MDFSLNSFLSLKLGAAVPGASFWDHMLWSPWEGTRPQALHVSPGPEGRWLTLEEAHGNSVSLRCRMC